MHKNVWSPYGLKQFKRVTIGHWADLDGLRAAIENRRVGISEQNTQPAGPPTRSSVAPQAPAFDLKALSRQWAKELGDNLNRNVMLDAEVDEAIRSQLSAKDWTQAKAEKIAAEVRAKREK